MSDLGDGLRNAIEGAAPPVTLDELAARDSARDRSGRRGAPWRTFVAGVAAAVLVIVGAVVAVNLGDDDPPPTRIAAPTVVVGDIDLAVLSTSFDDDGARGPIDPSVVDVVRAVPGVAGAQGAMQRFVDVVPTTLDLNNQPPASERSAIAISWEDGAPLTFSAGGPPQGAREVAINQSLADQYQLTVGDLLQVRTGGQMGPVGALVLPSGEVQPVPTGPSGATSRVVGVFTSAGGDVEDINVVVMRSEELGVATRQDSFDRIDIVATNDVPVDELIDRVSAALPAGTMAVPPSVIGFDEQLRAELEIQRAYHWILNPNRDVRSQASDESVDSPAGEQNQQAYDRGKAEILETEFRVSRVSFTDAATALVTYRIYYAGQPAARYRPMTGVAERVDGAWRVSQASLCDQLAQASDSNCASSGGPIASLYGQPPNGWNSMDSVPDAVQAFRVLADPTTTTEQRVEVVDRGDQLRDAIKAGVDADAMRKNAVSFTVSGARLLDATHAQILYSVIADGEPRLETPYPLVGNAVLVDGTWKVASRFACGLTALATLACPAAAALPTTTTSLPTTTSSTSTTSPVSTTEPPSTVPPTTDPDAVEVPTTRP